MGYEKLSEMTVAYAKGIPLALEVLGSHFHSRDKAYWESELEKLRKYPRPEIQNILKALESCGFKAVSGIQNLMDKSLIKPGWLHDENIEMHDLIRQVAEQIVRVECKKDPALRSRLNDADEICNVLQRNKDLVNLKILHLRGSKQLMELPDFSRAHNLEKPQEILFIIKEIGKFVFRGTGVEILHLLPMGGFTELKDLKIFGERLRSLPISELCSLTNLEAFEIWDFQQALTSLKHISLRDCEMLKSILGLPPFLEDLDAEGCTSLEIIFSDSLVQNPCRFDFQECIKLDECSLRFIEKLTHFSFTSAKAKWLPNVGACYAGSRVPKWMEYKHQTEASNAIEFICNLERSPTILGCCVVPPHLCLPSVQSIYCDFSYNDSNKSCNSFPLYCGCKMEPSHVYIWNLEGEGIEKGFVWRWNR
ncbi:disease resistance-like protein DSC1 [Prosopis cineraria]|uniref:disease resistance-like protein DSC1 n=1 Tax=Prosopis cineraria TaxID=364024 RepID=UPI00240F6BA8|nr:disease resistance-like protein DSC1 [Prosopis cineraria]